METENKQTENTMPVGQTPNINELEVFYTWQAPLRPFKKRNREFWTTVLAIIFLVGLILFFVKEWFLIAAIISLTFVYYVLSTVQPEEVEHQLTNRGLLFAGTTYPWDTITRFWFDKKYDQDLICVELNTGLVNRLSLLLGRGDQEKIQDIFQKYVMEEKASPTFMDKAAGWLSEKVPLDGTAQK